MTIVPLPTLGRREAAAAALAAKHRHQVSWRASPRPWTVRWCGARPPC